MEQELRLNSDLPGLLVRGKILSARDAKLLLHAEELLGKAQSYATALLKKFEHECEKKLSSTAQKNKALRSKARREGLEEGRQIALKELFAIKAKSAEDIARNQANITQAVLEAVRHIVGTIDADELAHRLISKALKQLSAAQRISIYLHPHQRDAIAANFSQHKGTQSFKFLAEPKLKLGESIVECELGTITNRIEARLKTLEKTLSEHLGESHHG